MKKKSNSYAKWGYIFVAPFTIAFLIFTLYPIAYTVVLGFTDFKGLTTTTFHFLDDPFGNFKSILGNPTFMTALKNTFSWRYSRIKDNRQKWYHLLNKQQRHYGLFIV